MRNVFKVQKLETGQELLHKEGNLGQLQSFLLVQDGLRKGLGDLTVDLVEVVHCLLKH